ncbi:hypothetical protein CLOM_g12542 [Closterium sp. NIES-68]|nr:hypothetical protein CLOM_g12542 [Closterium sp. NIES-68]
MTVPKSLQDRIRSMDSLTSPSEMAAALRAARRGAAGRPAGGSSSSSRPSSGGSSAGKPPSTSNSNSNSNSNSTSSDRHNRSSFEARERRVDPRHAGPPRALPSRSSRPNAEPPSARHAMRPAAEGEHGGGGGRRDGDGGREGGREGNRGGREGGGREIRDASSRDCGGRLQGEEPVEAYIPEVGEGGRTTASRSSRARRAGGGGGGGGSGGGNGGNGGSGAGPCEVQMSISSGCSEVESVGVMSEPALPPIRDLSPLSARRALSTCSSSAFRTYITARFQDAQSLGLNRAPPPAEHLLPSAASDASGSGSGGGSGTAQLLPRLVMSRASAQEGSREDGARRLSLDVYSSRRQVAEGGGETGNRGGGGEAGAMGLRDDELSAKSGRFSGHMAAIRRLQSVRRADLVAGLLSDGNWPAGLAMDDRVKLDRFAALFPSHSYRNSSSSSASLSASLVAGIPVFSVSTAAQCGGRGRRDSYSSEGCLLNYYVFLQMLFLDVFWASLASMLQSSVSATSAIDALMGAAWEADTPRDGDGCRSPSATTTATPGTPRARVTPRSPLLPPASPRASHDPFPPSPKLSPSAAASAAALAPSGPALQRAAALRKSHDSDVVPKDVSKVAERIVSVLIEGANGGRGVQGSPRGAEGAGSSASASASAGAAGATGGSAREGLRGVLPALTLAAGSLTRNPSQGDLRSSSFLALAIGAGTDAKDAKDAKNAKDATTPRESGGGLGLGGSRSGRWRGGQAAERERDGRDGRDDPYGRENGRSEAGAGYQPRDSGSFADSVGMPRSGRDDGRRDEPNERRDRDERSGRYEGGGRGKGEELGIRGAEEGGRNDRREESRGDRDAEARRGTGRDDARERWGGNDDGDRLGGGRGGAEGVGESGERGSSSRRREERREAEREARREAEREEQQRQQRQWRRGDDPAALTADASKRFEKTLFGGAGGGAGGGGGLSRLRSLSPLRSTSPHRPVPAVSPVSPYQSPHTAAPMPPYRAPEAALPPAPMTPRSPVAGGDSGARTADGGRWGREQRWQEMAQQEMNQISPGRFPPVSPRALPPGSPYYQPSAALQSPRTAPMSPHALSASPRAPMSPLAPNSPYMVTSPLASVPPSPYAPMSPYAAPARGGVSPASPAITPAPKLTPLKLPPGRSLTQQPQQPQQQQPSSPLAAEPKPSPLEARKPPALDMAEPRTPTAAGVASRTAAAAAAAAAPCSPAPHYYQPGDSPRHPGAGAPWDAGLGGGYRSPANVPVPAQSPYQRSVSPIHGAAAAAVAAAAPVSPRPSDSNKSSSLYRSSPTRHERFKMLYQKQKQQRPAARPSPRYTPSQVPQPAQQQMPARPDAIPRCATPPRETLAKVNSFQPSPLLLPTAPPPRSPSPWSASPAAAPGAGRSPQPRRSQASSVQVPASPLRPPAPNLPDFEPLDALGSPRDMLPPSVSPFQKGYQADFRSVSPPPRGSLLASTPRKYPEDLGKGGGAGDANLLPLHAYSARRAHASPLQEASRWNNVDSQPGKESSWDAADKGEEVSRSTSKVEADAHAGRASPLRSSRSWRQLIPSLGKIRGASPRRLADPDEIPPVEPDVKFQQVQQWLWSQPDNPGEDEEDDWKAQERAVETSEASQTSPGEQPEVSSTRAGGGHRGTFDAEERRRKGLDISRLTYDVDEPENDLARGSLRVAAISTSKVMQDRANNGALSPEVSPRAGAGTGWKKVMGLGSSNRSPERVRKTGPGRLVTAHDSGRVENKAEQYRLFRAGSPLKAVLRRGAP